jgi:FdhE protein
MALSGGGELGEIPHLRLPRPEALFAGRAERFAALALGHTLREYLEFLACLAGAQAVACATVRPPVNGAGLSRERPLDAASHRRTPEWLEALAVILAEVSTAAALPEEVPTTLDLLHELPPLELEVLADRVLANAVLGTDLGAGPFVAAALQVYFTALAAQLREDAIEPARDGCPVCGSLPVVGLVLGDDKLRYLVCSLCATQWHHTRVQCTACHSGEGISYYTLERARAAREGGDAGAEAPPSAPGVTVAPGPPRVKAEACPSCKAYTKLFYAESDPRLDPFADDVATLSLDLLMAEDGWVRHGVNLFLVPGEERAPVQ